ncbi:MAG: PEP-CTERM sorting domain-containing protein [Candidatus Omnitrophica bacterium]|nr:PEP-CTERM sorting domain-containing protein [Candidatus Omnitrophota bacterium]
MAVLGVGLAAAVAVASPAWAVPTIDGSATTFAGEWDGFILQAFDPDEVAIPDGYDFSELRIIQEASGGASDGLYVLFDLHGVPTFTSLDPIFPFDPVTYSIGMDFDGDGLFTSAVDRSIVYTSSGVLVFDGTGTPIVGAPGSALGSVVELYIPKSMLAGGALPVSGTFGMFASLDNGGAPPDDFIPDFDLVHPIPEPGSALLFGFGLMGAFLRRQRRYPSTVA